MQLDSMKISTTDLPLAASLQSLGYIPTLEKSSDNRILFVFPKSPETVKAMSDYWTNLLKVNPKLLWTSVRELKSRISNFQVDPTKLWNQ
jgi:hypothetical protein